MNKFSGLVIAFNEEKRIRNCLTSLYQVCDDVVVIDSYSEDRTVEIARDMGAKIIQHKFLGDGPQRSFGLAHCKHEWIINLDADERMDEALRNELPKLDLHSASIDAYECRRKNHFNGNWIKVAGQYPDYICRVFNKSKTGFSPVQIHTRIESKNLAKLKGHILHDSFEDLNDMIRRMNLYSEWQSEILFEENTKISTFKPWVHCLISFIKFYIVKRGFLAGLDGMNISIANSLGTYYKYAKLIEKNRQRDAKLIKP